MSSLKHLWPQVITMAKNSGLPERPRAILREYLQVKALNFIYSRINANKLSFIGGTSLRLLFNLPRFSEDLDFDNLGLTDKQMVKLMNQVVAEFKQENIPLDFYQKITEGKTYFELRFPQILKELNITTNPREKLMIKIDYSRSWKGQKTEVVLLNRFGIIQNLLTNTLDQILVQKLSAYAGRRLTQPRDMYDIVWLYGQGARIDSSFIKANHQQGLFKKAKRRWAKEMVTTIMKRRLAPFLFKANEVQKLALFGEVLKKLT